MIHSREAIVTKLSHLTHSPGEGIPGSGLGAENGEISAPRGSGPKFEDDRSLFKGLSCFNFFFY